jgi:putative ABC transport system substrate-binding protein
MVAGHTAAGNHPEAGCNADALIRKYRTVGQPGLNRHVGRAGRTCQAWRIDSRPVWSHNLVPALTDRVRALAEGISRARLLLFGLAATVIAGAGLVLPGAATAQPASRMARIGALWQTAPPPPPHPHLEAMIRALREKGWQDGKTAVFEYRYGGSDPARLAEHAQDLIARKVDVIVTVGDLATRAAQNATRSVPIVAVVGFPVESGFVTSLARPGGNLTGVGVYADDLAAKRLELLKELLPGLKRVALLWDPVTHPRQRELAEQAAQRLGLSSLTVSPRSAQEFDAAFNTAVAARVDAMLVLVSPTFIAQRDRLVQLAAKHRVPAMYTAQTFTDVGGLISYGPAFEEIWRLGGGLIDEVLRGARPADLPFQRPAGIQVDLNMRTARQIGVNVPNSIMVRAERVIE